MSRTSRCSECGALSAPPLQEALDLVIAPGTRHHTLMNTNESPEGSESTFIESVISKADARLACLDKEISKLQETLKQLEEERASLTNYMARNKAILSPLRRMPPEVLGEIFSWTTPSIVDHLIMDVSTFAMKASPWVLTHISTRWRTISLSTPSLWSQFIIDFHEVHASTNGYRYSLPQVETQLRRSRKLKLHFYGCPDMDPRPQIQLFELLSRESSRWEELSLVLISDIVPSLAALRDRVPSLKKLWIQWAGPESQTVESLDCFQTASSLSNVGIFNQYRFILIALPIHQLTRYELDCTWEKHKGMLNLAPNLVEAYIVIEFDEDVWTQEIIDLPHLRRLYVSEARVLDCLKVPRLEELALWVAPDDTPDLLQLESFLHRSACPLRYLCMKGFPSARGTTAILGKLPHITGLAIMINESDAADGINALMSSLTVSELPGSTMIAPHIKCLIFGCEEEGWIDYTAYLVMLESRWKPENYALKNAVLLTEPEPDPAALHGLDALRRKGLDLSVMTGAEARNEMHRLSFSMTWN